MKKLLIVIDMQNDFIYGSLGTGEARAILPNVRRKIEEYRHAGQDVVFTRDTHDSHYLNTQEGKNLPVPHCIKDTDGWQIVDGLRLDEKVFDKPTFGSQELATFVQAGGYDEIALVGVCTDICVLSNAVLIKTACAETPLKVYENCCAGVTPKAHDAAIAVLSSIQVQIL